MSKGQWNITSAVTGLVLGALTYALLAPGAYAERGYFAVGGEGLLALIAVSFTGPMLIWKREEIIALHKKLLQRAIDKKCIERSKKK